MAGGVTSEKGITGGTGWAGGGLAGVGACSETGFGGARLERDCAYSCRYHACISAHKWGVDSSKDIAGRTRHLFATVTFRGCSWKQISEDFGRRQQGSPEF